MQIEISGLEHVRLSEQKMIEKTIRRVLCGAALPEYSVNVSLVDQKTMKDLNHRFKDKKKTTDVLSFPLPEMERTFSHTQKILGDVVISVPQAEKQALDLGHSLAEEIAVLSAHGLFHLLGYDHEVSDEEASMQMQGEMFLLEMAGFSAHLSLIGRV